MGSIYVIHSSSSTCEYNSPAQHNKKRKREQVPVVCGTATLQTEFAGSTASTRRATYPYTGCLTHADITYHIANADQSIEGVKRVIAYLEHNNACKSATMVRPPPVPLHSHVLEVALCQLRNGAGYVQLMPCSCVLYHSSCMTLESAHFRR